MEALRKIFDAVLEPLKYLYIRWQDEKEYEDFSDYSDKMRELVSNLDLEGVSFIKATKSPFGFIVSIPNLGKIQFCLLKQRLVARTA